MFLADLLLAFAVAIVFTVIFLVGFRKQEYGSGLWLVFLILFLGTWAGGLWLAPVGPSLLWGASWLSYVIVGFFLVILVTLLIPVNTKRKYKRNEEHDQGTEAKATTSSIVALDIFFWILMITLGIVIIASYI